MKINVVHIVEDLKTGGLERVIAACTTDVDKEKFHARVWCLVQGGDIFDELKANGVDVEVLHMKSHRDVSFLMKLIGKLKKERIHIVHTHGYPGNTLGRMAAFLAGVRVIIAHMHSTYFDYNRKQLFIERLFSYFTTKIICCSKAVAKFVEQKEKIHPKKIEIIYNGVDTDTFGVIFSEKKEEKKRITVGCVASLVEHKGHAYIIEAAKQLVDESRGRIRFIFAGDGVLRNDLQKQAKTLGIGEYVSFLGNVSNVAALMATFDIGILASSQREGLGIALLEAMSIGMPVIGTNIGGIPEIIRNKRNGLLVAPKDPLAIAQAIKSLVEDWGKALEMGRNARNTVEKYFSKTMMINKISRLYLELYYGKK